jgi:hypothetical protein
VQSHATPLTIQSRPVGRAPGGCNTPECPQSLPKAAAWRVVRKHWAPAQLRRREISLRRSSRTERRSAGELNSRERHEPVLNLKEFSLAHAIPTQFEFVSSGEALQKLTNVILPNLGNATPVIHLQRQNMYERQSLPDAMCVSVA